MNIVDADDEFDRVMRSIFMVRMLMKVIIVLICIIYYSQDVDADNS